MDKINISFKNLACKVKEIMHLGETQSLFACNRCIHSTFAHFLYARHWKRLKHTFMLQKGAKREGKK